MHATPECDSGRVEHRLVAHRALVGAGREQRVRLQRGADLARARLHGLSIIGATLTPFEGVNTYTAAGEQMRQQVNQWIRSSGSFDAVIDFDLATRDPDRPTRLRPEFDSGDHIHPNDAGNRAMAEAVDLKLFR